MSFNISKLITIFLVLAVLAGGTVMIFQGGPDPSVSAPGEAPKQISLAGTNSFVEQLPAGEPGGQTAAAPAKKNLTDIFAEAIGKNLLDANPQGPAEYSDGFAALPPDTTSTLASFFDNPEVYQPILSDAVAVLARRSDPKKVQVVKNAPEEVQTAYLYSLASILEKQFLDERFARLVQSDPTPDAVNASEVRLDQILKKMDELRVPDKYLDLHLAGRDMILRLRDLATTQADNSDDPVRDMLALEREFEVVNSAIANFQKESSKTDWTAAISRSGDQSWLGLLGIRIAQAQIPVTDVANAGLSAAKLGKTIADWVKMYLTELLKNTLIHRIMQQTTTWIQGGGKPKFITNWKSFLSNAAEDAVGKTISRINPQICAPFRPLIRIAFQSTNLAPEESISCTLDQVIANVRNFYDDFSDGGWLAYGAVMKPQNNVYGILIETSDIISSEAAKTSDAKQQEASAGKGFLPTTFCVKPEKYATFKECMDKLGDVDSCSPPGGFPYEGCLEYKSTTPGASVGEVAGLALQAPLQRIVSAQDIAGLINALTNSLLNKVVNSVRKSKGDPGLLGAEVGAGTGTTSFESLCDSTDRRAYQQCQKETQKACQGLPPEMQSDCQGAIADEPPAAGEPYNTTSTLPGETP